MTGSSTITADRDPSTYLSGATMQPDTNIKPPAARDKLHAYILFVFIALLFLLFTLPTPLYAGAHPEGTVLAIARAIAIAGAASKRSGSAAMGAQHS